MKSCTFHSSLEKKKMNFIQGNFFITQETETLQEETKKLALKKFIVPYIAL